MKVVLSAALVLALAILVVAVPASAHHGFSVEFDANKCMDLKGTLTNVQWENPHAYLDMDVKNAEGKVISWHLEMVTPNALSDRHHQAGFHEQLREDHQRPGLLGQGGWRSKRRGQLPRAFRWLDPSGWTGRRTQDRRAKALLSDRACSTESFAALSARFFVRDLCNSVSLN